MNKRLLRIIDANLNRTREGLRVCEDITRFAVADKHITRSLKFIRHAVTLAAIGSKELPLKKLLKTRDARKDVSRFVDFKKRRDIDISGIFMSNIERVKESLRVLEECCKIIDEGLARKYRRLRFDAYDIEKRAVEKIRNISSNRQARFKG